MFQFNKINYKKVRFSRVTYTVYIQPIYDIKENLWWSQYDHLHASNKSLLELKELMNRHPLMTIKQARKLLYQPNNLSIYDPSNFE
jgi:hypothetical protein